MTVLSTKKSTNNNRDSTTNQQQQPQQQQQQTSNTQQQQPISTLTRTRVSHDDEHSIRTHSLVNSNDDSDDVNDRSPSPSSLSPTTTNNFQSMLTTTTTSMFSNQSKRKSHYHNSHHTQQVRRRCQTHDNEQYNSEDEYEHTSVKYDGNNLDEVRILSFFQCQTSDFILLS